jgi:pimeloyl-ACP methyl ester carboxylesterase
LTKIEYLSELDQSMQPAWILPAEGQEKRPLAVCLHTWSYGIEDGYENFVNKCKEYNFHMIFPLFRGPNWNPDACGSDLVVSDLSCAVTYMRENYDVDEQKIYLVGGSGGGHASLLMAGRKPELFTAISAWCPISDLIAWFQQVNEKKKSNPRRTYDDHIFEACGGNPWTNPNASAQAKHRSPITWLANATDNVILDIGTGIHDGHTRFSVPVSHSIEAFNLLAAPQDRISAADIDIIVKTETVPEHLRYTGMDDPAYGPYKVLLRRTSQLARLTLFEGAHDLLPSPAFGFLERQERGAAPVWSSGEEFDSHLNTELGR